MNKIIVLLVEDHRIMFDGLRALLSIHQDIEVVGESMHNEAEII